MKKLFSLFLTICAIAVIPVQAMTSEEKILTCRDSVTVTMSLRAYGNAYLAEYAPGSFQGWDGTYNGHPMPSDDYWYLIRIASTGETMHGHFTLRR